jgi:hypothetical protein
MLIFVPVVKLRFKYSPKKNNKVSIELLKIYFVGPRKNTNNKNNTTRIIFKLLSLLIPFCIPKYELEANMNEQIAIVVISKEKFLSMLKIVAITDEISGKERPNPTPAAHIIEPIKITSNNNFMNLLFMLRIPENVNDEFDLFDRAKANATTGKQ